MSEEIMIHKNQTELNDYLYNYDDIKIFKCKVCDFVGSSKVHDFVCTNSLSDEYNKDVYKYSGCNFFKKYDDEAMEDLETKSLWS